MAEPLACSGITPGIGAALGASLPTKISPEGLETRLGGCWRCCVLLSLLLHRHHLLCFTPASAGDVGAASQHRDAVSTGDHRLAALPRCSAPPHQICITFLLSKKDFLHFFKGKAKIFISPALCLPRSL